MSLRQETTIRFASEYTMWLVGLGATNPVFQRLASSPGLESPGAALTAPDRIRVMDGASLGV